MEEKHQTHEGKTNKAYDENAEYKPMGEAVSKEEIEKLPGHFDDDNFYILDENKGKFSISLIRFL
jgi:hypothetical protein